MTRRFKRISINYPMVTCPECKGKRFTEKDADGRSRICPCCTGDGSVQIKQVQIPKDPSAVPNKLIRDIIAADIRARENEVRP